MAKLRITIKRRLSILAGVLVVIVITQQLTSEHSDQQDAATDHSLFGRNVQNPSLALGDKADPSYVISLPQDHNAHNHFDIEWWYLTANLQDEDGQDYGLQWTLFRFTNPLASSGDEPTSTWHNEQIYMAHGSVHSMQAHWFAEKFARGGVGNAGVKAKPFSLFMDDWYWHNTEENEQHSNRLLPAQLGFSLPQQADNKAKLEIQLNLTQSGPYVFHGQNGYSIKSANGKHASHYYSAPFIEVAGLFTFKNKLNESTSKPVSGIAWFDQEWTSQLLDTDTQGWDWLSLHLDNGSKIMAFRMRLKNQPDYITGSYIDAKGQLTTLAPEDLSLSPESSTELTMADGSIKSVPLIWKLRIPSKDIDLVIEALKKDQWNPALISYYEGMVSIKGSHLGKGFLELTGY